MSILHALFLGIIQGITEFFPVSSSGHLLLFQRLFGLENFEHYIKFDLVCHLGTLFAILIVYKNALISLFSENRKTVWQAVIGTIPLFLVAPFLKKVELFFEKPEYLGLFFLITSACLFAAATWGYHKQDLLLNKTWKRDSFIIGIFQTIALFPGISRSAMTISSARLLGWGEQKAIFFSFLLSIPAILGAISLKGMQTLISPPIHTSSSLGFSHYAVGFLSAFFFGYLSLLALIRLASKGNLRYFVWYCALIGSALCGYQLFIG